MRELEPMRVRVTREEGVYAFRHHACWWVPRDTAPADWPCLLYWNRYRFAVDPLASLASNRRGSTYFQVMVEPDTRYFYHQEDVDRDLLTVGDLTDLGVSLQPDAHLKADFASKIVLGY